MVKKIIILTEVSICATFENAFNVEIYSTTRAMYIKFKSYSRSGNMCQKHLFSMKMGYLDSILPINMRADICI